MTEEQAHLYNCEPELYAHPLLRTFRMLLNTAVGKYAKEVPVSMIAVVKVPLDFVLFIQTAVNAISQNPFVLLRLVQVVGVI